jgi:hypothetical protein
MDSIFGMQCNEFFLVLYLTRYIVGYTSSSIGYVGFFSEYNNLLIRKLSFDGARSAHPSGNCTQNYDGFHRTGPPQYRCLLIQNIRNFGLLSSLDKGMRTFFGI